MKHLAVSLDLEMNQPSGRIVQIGAVVGDLRTGVVLSRISLFVNPGEPLAPFISDLCGITPETLEMAGPLHEAYAHLRQWLLPFDPDRQLNPLTWGGGDSLELREQLALDDARWVFGRRWLDVKTVYTARQQALGKDVQGGLSTCMKKVGLLFEGRKHDALDDAFNTFRMHHRLLRLIAPALHPET